jgi:hypothetical protein
MLNDSPLYINSLSHVSEAVETTFIINLFFTLNPMCAFTVLLWSALSASEMRVPELGAPQNEPLLLF